MTQELDSKKNDNPQAKKRYAYRLACSPVERLYLRRWRDYPPWTFWRGDDGGLWHLRTPAQVAG